MRAEAQKAGREKGQGVHLEPEGLQALRDDLDRFWSAALAGFARIVEEES